MVTDKEMADLIQHHRAIEAHMTFLTKSLKNLTRKSQGEGKSVQLKEKITLYRWSLYDFREAISRHIELDERIFQGLQNSASSAELTTEHGEIKKRIDDIIQQAENAVYNRLSREELKQSANAMTGTVKDVCKICEAHIAKEDALLIAGQGNS